MEGVQVADGHHIVNGLTETGKTLVLIVKDMSDGKQEVRKQTLFMLVRGVRDEV